jgi:hypothetical protein
MQGFRVTLTNRQAEMHAANEQSFEDMRVKIREAVIIEVLKVFP